ncbi:MAG TPA: efflux RND transporter periplasmic adaptor subunit [Bryobacteraceae bacterium]|nr:efflux RND transporter periplasmic adaptor subunit [Bryobacteraceae bacterium]
MEARQSPGPETSNALAPHIRQIRATGTIQAVKSFTVQVPQLSGRQSRITLVKLAPNGMRVKAGDLLAEFDRTQQIDLAREAKAKFEDLSHQVMQKQAQNRNDAEKRGADLKQAEADLAKAEIQLKKAEVISAIERDQNQAKADSARTRVVSLKKVDQLRRQAEAAALRILELQRDRQKVALERAESNLNKLTLKAPIAGMVALENIWRSGSMGNAQEGDQLWTGQNLLKIFDPDSMEVRAEIGEPDGAILKPGTVATVFIDAYPDASFKAYFHSANPVATAAIGSPIKNFSARFRIEGMDPRLLPDLSAAIVLRADRPDLAAEAAVAAPPAGAMAQPTGAKL